MNKYISPGLIKVFIANVAVVVVEFLYVAVRVKYLNEQIPLWYSMPWGIYQLASRGKLFLVPVISLGIIAGSVVFAYLAKKRFLRYGEEFLYVFASLCNLLLAFAIYRTVQIAAVPFPPIINPGLVSLLPPMVFSALVVYAITPKLLAIFKERGIVTDPQIHKHPGMLLTKPAARGGGIVFTLGILISAVFFLRFTPIIGWLLAAISAGSILGLLDDIQNTNPIKKLKFIENPINRILLQGLIVLPLVLAGVQILFITNPFGGVIYFDHFKLSLLGITVAPLAIAVTIVWVLWIMNVLSWSNGVDGQFAGIVGIAAIILALITMRETPLNLQQKDMLMLAALTAGAALGTLPHTWHPSKMLWGFGAVSAGILLATISTLTKAKIAAALIVLAIPFLDGMITVVKRIIRGKSPMKGDRGHLHHILLERGWSTQKVAMFYWLSTLVTGFIGIKSADKNPMLIALTVGGFVAFIIIIVNIKKPRSKNGASSITQLAEDGGK